ncbi:MAG: hypothetical protein M1822_007082 [Bathelium mastoideum]|nr:MAG: hypothetical protein M1822_007082 [Bathelium mastoideum]
MARSTLDGGAETVPLMPSGQQSEASISIPQTLPGEAKMSADDRPYINPENTPHARSSTEREEEEAPLVQGFPHPSSPAAPTSQKPASWASLPQKGQLAILIFARFSEPLAQTSLMAYMFYQLRWFDPALPDSTISWQAGILQASFSATQCFTAALWGKAADHVGRKPIVLLGLTSLCLSCFVYAFSTSFLFAVLVRCAGGAMNGNVGLMRTMISEIVPDKQYQSRAFLLLPTFLNIGAILGPIIGGFLADPIHNLTRVFGPHSLFGGADGLLWMERWPFALPGLFTGTVLLFAILLVFLGLDETHEHIKHEHDRGRKFTRYLRKRMSFRRTSTKETSVECELEPLNAEATEDLQATDKGPPDAIEGASAQPELPNLSFRRTWTRNVLLSLLSHFFVIFNIATFNSLLYTFLPTPRSPQPTDSPESTASHLTGGLGLSESNVGLATSLIGFLGFPLQLLLYPVLQSRYGTLKCYQIFLPFAALAAFLVPMLVLLPNHPWAIWPSLATVLAFEVLASTFALPGSIILINESVPTAQVKGLIHGVGQSVASAAKTVGPILGGWGLSVGLQRNAVGTVWWTLGAVTLVGWSCAWAIREEKEADGEEKGNV